MDPLRNNFFQRVVEILVIFASVLTYSKLLKGQFYETSTYKTALSAITALLLSKSGILENEGLDAIDRSIQNTCLAITCTVSFKCNASKI